MNLEEKQIETMIAELIASKKYRHSGLNQTTVKDLIRKAAPQHTSQKALLKTVKRKLHNIVAPYLGELVYADLMEKLLQFNNPALTDQSLRGFCLQVLSQHASTAERIPIMAGFYSQLFQAAGNPQVIVDLACGLHPLAFPWMGLPTTVRYHAYDIIQPRVNFINQFFTTIGLAPLAESRDILVDPPNFAADLAIFFKEAHRFEKRQPGCNRLFWESLNVKVLAVSLPSTDLAGTHSLLNVHRRLIHANLPEQSRVEEIFIENEIIFLIRRNEVSNNG
jgi:16S rRNA (guanine(1405)-N(7))-methyltransferase